MSQRRSDLHTIRNYYEIIVASDIFSLSIKIFFKKFSELPLQNCGHYFLTYMKNGWIFWTLLRVNTFLLRTHVSIGYAMARGSFFLFWARESVAKRDSTVWRKRIDFQEINVLFETISV